MPFLLFCVAEMTRTCSKFPEIHLFSYSRLVCDYYTSSFEPLAYLYRSTFHCRCSKADVKDLCWEINIHYTLSRILLCFNIFYITRLTVECKTLRKGFLAVGIAMIVLAVILFAPSSWIKGVQSSNVQKCNSFTGQLFETLSQEDSAICHMAPALLVMSQTVLVVSILLSVLGVALVIIGAIKERPKPIKDEID